MRFGRCSSSSKLDLEDDENAEDASAFAETVKDVVGRKHKLVHMAMVQLEVKTDRPENRVLAMSEHKLYVLLPRVPARLEHSVSFLDLQAIESRSTLQMVLTSDTKRLVFQAVQGDSVLFNHVITHIGVSLTTVFPSVALEKLVHKVSVSPIDRLSLMQEKIKAIKRKDQGPCGGFSVAYRFMCFYHVLPYMEDVAWDVDTIYLSHDTKELDLGDFDHLDPRHLIPIISTLEHNTWFTKLNASNIKLSLEATTEVLKVMKKNTTIEELQLSNIGIKWDFANKLAQALMSNANSPLAKLDLSCNFIEDKGINHLCGPLSQLSRGLVYLNLAKTGVTARGINRLSEALAANKFISTTLKHLDLSDNQFRGEEVANLYNFLAHPNAITTLTLSGNECALEMIFGALLRGCSQSLTHLDLSRNLYSTRRARDPQIPGTWQQFFAGTMSLEYVNLSECRLPPEAIKHVLLGIGSNPNTRGLELNLSCNNLGNAGTDFIDACFSNLNNVSTLDISDNGLDMLVKLVVEQLAGNSCLQKLLLGKNFTGIKAKNLPGVLESIVKMIQEEDSVLESLSLADSKLKLETTTVINSLGGNTSLTEIDVSGNQMGDTGARMLAKALQINTKLRSVLWDRNGTTPQGFTDIAAAMEKNFALKTMPTPVHDATLALKFEPEKSAQALERIESLLQRNHSPRKFASDQGYRLQQGFLISSTQQMVDKNVVQIQEAIKELEQGDPSRAVKDDIRKAVSVVKEAHRSTQILPKLQEVSLKSEQGGGTIDEKIRLLSVELQMVLDSQLRKNVREMLRCVEDQCPTIVGEKDLREEMKTACTEKGALPKTFCQSLLQDQVGTDVFNKISELNLAVASQMTDRLVDGILESLERAYSVLVRHLKAQKRGSTDSEIKADKDQPLAKKKDTLGLPPESPGPLPKIGNKRESVYSRRLRPQSVIVSDADSRSIDTVDSISTVDSSLDSREGTPTSETAPTKSKGAKAAKKHAIPTLELPSLPLNTEAPKLEHLGKARPKRAKTKAMGRPVIRAEDILIEEAELVDHGVDTFFENKPVAKEVTKEVTSPVATSHSEQQLNKQNSLDEKVIKEDAGAKKKGWSPFSGGDSKGLAAGIGNFFRKSPKPQDKDRDRDTKKGDPDKTTPPSRKSPEIDLEKEDSGGFKSEEDKDEVEEEIKVTPKKQQRGIGLPGMGGPGGGGGGALMAEMKMKRETMKPTAPAPPKKVEEEKYRSPKDTGAATTISRPPAGGTLHPPAAGAKVTSPVSEDSTSNGPTPKSRGVAPMRPKPPPVAPKPRGSSIAQPPVAAPRQSTNPPARPSDIPDEKPKSAPTDPGLDSVSRTEQQKKRSSVKMKAALLDKNSNETPSGESSQSSKSKAVTLPREGTPEKGTNAPQRSLSSGSKTAKSAAEKEEEKPSDAAKEKSEGSSRSSPDMQVNGSSTKAAETTQEIYL